jgi:hypothetical protein
VLVDASPTQADAILRAMRDVATARGTDALTDADRAALVGASTYVFRRPDPLDPDQLGAIEPSELRDVVGTDDVGHHAVQFLTVMALVDGEVDEARITDVLRFAAALDVHEDSLRQLAALGRGRLRWLVADVQRQNLLSITGEHLRIDEDAWILPYREHPDPTLAARYDHLGELPTGTFGRAFFEFYSQNRFSFPGSANSVNAEFATPHDSTHVLSGYDTSPQGELLVSTFTAGMHPHEPMSGHILPVILSWHLGVELVKFAGRYTGGLDPEKFCRVDARERADDRRVRPYLGLLARGGASARRRAHRLRRARARPALRRKR